MTSFVVDCRFIFPDCETGNSWERIGCNLRYSNWDIAPQLHRSAATDFFFFVVVVLAVEIYILVCATFSSTPTLALLLFLTLKLSKTKGPWCSIGLNQDWSAERKSWCCHKHQRACTPFDCHLHFRSATGLRGLIFSMQSLFLFYFGDS